MAAGALIVLEGIDGAGKSTLQNALAAFFQAHGREVVSAREPTNGPHGQALREAAKVRRLPPEEELQLLLKDRAEHVQNVIRPALQRAAVVLLDRYYFSTIAYQGAAGVPADRIKALHHAFAPEPTVLLLLDLPVPDALQRIRARGAGSDDFERADTLERVRNIFLSFADLPYAHLLDARDSPALLCAKACAKLSLIALNLERR
jgi:dTMP kinase